MKKLLWSLAALLSVTAHAEGPGLKAGLWETKVIHQVMDGHDMTAQMNAAQARMQEAMAHMSAAQRQQMQAMMKGRGADLSGNNGTARICVSPEMAGRNTPLVDREGHCAPAKVEHSGNKTSFEFNCKTNGRTMVGRGENIIDGDTVATRMDMTTTDASGQHSMQTESRLKYLGADCQGLKSIDQIGKSLPRK